MYQCLLSNHLAQNSLKTVDRALTALEVVNNNGPAINIPETLMHVCINGWIDEWMDG